MKLLLAGGGTGGHLVPGLAVAEALRQRQPGSQVWVFGTPRPIDRKLVPAAGIPLIEQTVRPFSTRPWDWPGFYLAWRASCRIARRFLLAERPDFVLGLGGYAAGPAVAQAARLGIRTAILNPDAVPGRANRYLARRADRVFCQWDVTRKFLPRPETACITGSPVRAGLDRLDRAACRTLLGLDPRKLTLLVTGASLGAGTINNMVAPLLERLAMCVAEPWQVLHQTGSVKAADELGLPAAASARFTYRTVDFISTMPEAIAAADVVICRAGASTLAELTAIGRPGVLLPYPFHRDEHQRHNGQVLVDAGAAVMLADVRDAAENAAQLTGPVGELMTNAARRETMSSAARAIGKPSAADAVVDEMLRM